MSATNRIQLSKKPLSGKIGVGSSRNGDEGRQWLLLSGLARNLFPERGTDEGMGFGENEERKSFAKIVDINPC